MGSLFKRKTTKNKQDRWTIQWVDENNITRTKKAYTDKAASRSLLESIEKKVEKIKRGFNSIAEEKARIPLQEIIKEYLSELKRTGRTPVYIRDQERLLQRIMRESNLNCLEEIRADKVRGFLAKLGPVSPRTVNAYRDALLMVCNWCRSNGYLDSNPVSIVRKARNQKGTKTRPRRAYTEEELKRLIESVDPNRSFTYWLMAMSGLRRNEAKLLEKQDLDPTAEKPYWKIRPEIQKNAWTEMIPMLPKCAKKLAEHWRSLKTPQTKVLSHVPLPKTFNRDLRKANIKKRDDQGRQVDMHSLRYTFCAMIAKQLPVQVVKVLMRHKTMRMTTDLYMTLNIEDIGEKIWDLPDLGL